MFENIIGGRKGLDGEAIPKDKHFHFESKDLTTLQYHILWLVIIFCELLCTHSLAITEKVANALSFCVGAANSPFANIEATQICDRQGVSHIAENISSSAGEMSWGKRTVLTFYY